MPSRDYLVEKGYIPGVLLSEDGWNVILFVVEIQ
jgi:hypothetical protein